MKFFLALALFVFCLATYAATPSQKLGSVHLDNTRGIVFEQFLSYTYALQLLQAKNQFYKNDLLIGGSLQSDLQRWQGDTIDVLPLDTYRQGSGFYLTQFTLDFMNNLNSWMTAFASLADSHIGRGEDDGNYIYTPNTFLLLGNLNDLPFYSVIGITDVAFGVFQGVGAWDNPLPADYFNPAQAPQISIGYYKNGLNLVATGFSDTTYHKNNYAYSVYYNKTTDSWSYSLGAGYLTNLLTNSTGNANIHKARSRFIQGLNMGQILDVNASVNYYQLGLTGEFARGNRTVGINTGAPNSCAVTASYAPTIYGRTTTFGISHSVTNHLRDIPTALEGFDALPSTISGLKNAWALSATRPFFTELFIVGLDLEKSITYSRKHSYTGTIDLMIYI